MGFNKNDSNLLVNVSTEKSISDFSDKNHIKNKSSDIKKSVRDLSEIEHLYSFMLKYKNTNKEAPWTNAMMYTPYGSYNIPDDKYHIFLSLYERAVIAGYNPYITEKHKEFGPIVIDFDFVQDKTHSERYYTEKTIRNIVKIYYNIINKYLNVTTSQSYAYVTEKEKPILRNNNYHDGIHIMFPYICTRPSIQMLIRDEFIKIATKNNVLKKIPLVNDIDSVIDKNVIYNSGWLLYGSRKNNQSPPYKVTYIFNLINNNLINVLSYQKNAHSIENIKHYVNVLRCRRFDNTTQLTALNDNIDPIIVDQKINTVKEKIISTDKNGIEITKIMGNEIRFIKAVSEELLVEAKNLVSLLSAKRATDYYTWYQVGLCLHNIDHRLIYDWIEFSKKCPSKFKIGECEKLWKKMKSTNYQLPTLHYFANEDNHEKYLEIKKSKIEKLVKEGLEISNTTCAKLLIEKYKFTYKCASIKQNLWYEFKNHRWIQIDSAYTLRNLISSEIIKEYEGYRSTLYCSLGDCADNKKEQDKLIDEANYVSKIIKQLNTTTFKNGVINECAYLAYDPNFLKNLDENIYLICFENGIYDLEANTFRPGCPDDYISLCTNYNYIPYDKKDTMVTEINDFFNKIQPDIVVREYLLKLLSTCLAGSIAEENFYVFTGSGANGKSKLLELLKYTLGDYFKPMDIRLLTEKRSSSSSASPELADKKGIRLTPFDEPKATDEINTGFMKLFTGGDMIPARALYKEPIYFKPQFKPILLCNNLPSIKSDDDGTWRRVKAVPFLSKFINMTDATKKMKKNGLGENQFWADNMLSEKLPEWKQSFMGILIYYYGEYKKSGLVHPKIVTQYTAEYRKRCDVFQDFIYDFLEKTDNANDVINIINLHENMRNWHRTNYEGKCPNTKDLRNYLQKRIPSFNSKTDSLTCYKIKTTENEESSTILNEI